MGWVVMVILTMVGFGSAELPESPELQAVKAAEKLRQQIVRNRAIALNERLFL
ncbi:MAG: hypothetical protein LBI04_05860 [Treponema sp.]|jgi:hypothetical protein|nr:hypothetical protein [Treponema sp.]